MKLRMMIALLLLAPSALQAATLRVPEDHPTIQAAVEAARPGDTVKVGGGVFAENVSVKERILLAGSGCDKTTIRPEAGTGVAVRGRAVIEHMTIQAPERVVFAEAGSALTLRHCRIAGGKDGLTFTPDFNTSAVVHDCEFLRCGDAIDLESTQAIIFNNVFRGSRDDAIDFDGDAGGIVYGNTIVGCGDDGIEIRLRRITQAVIVRNTFERCGEDGLEIIDTTVKGTPAELAAQVHNLTVVAHNTFVKCTRYGVGAVTQTKPEEPGPDMVQTGLFGSNNTFSECGKGDVSPNMAPVDLRADRTAAKVTAEMTGGGRTWSRTLPIRPLVPLAIYDLKHDPAGKRVGDAEGVEVDLARGRAFIADDGAKAVWTLDLRTAGLVHKLPTNPFPGTSVKIGGTEGLAFDPVDASKLWLSCDDEKRLVQFSAAAESFGQVARTLTVAPKIHRTPEGIAVSGDTVYLAGARTVAATTAGADKLDFQVQYRFAGYGGHVAGIAHDGRRLLMTASGYSKRLQFNTRGLLLAADPATGEVTDAWSLADYCPDPRGVAFAGGLVFVCDGYGQRMLPDGKAANRQGLKLIVFALSPPTDFEALVPLLPLRRKPTEDAP